MSRYTLSINIQSDNKELLDNLMVTLETIHGDIAELDAVELFTSSNTASSNNKIRCIHPTTTQRNLFLDEWMLSEAL